MGLDNENGVAKWGRKNKREILKTDRNATRGGLSSGSRQALVSHPVPSGPLIVVVVVVVVVMNQNNIYSLSFGLIWSLI